MWYGSLFDLGLFACHKAGRHSTNPLACWISSSWNASFLALLDEVHIICIGWSGPRASGCSSLAWWRQPTSNNNTIYCQSILQNPCISQLLDFTTLHVYLCLRMLFSQFHFSQTVQQYQFIIWNKSHQKHQFSTTVCVNTGLKLNKNNTCSCLNWWANHKFLLPMHYTRGQPKVEISLLA